MDIGDLVMHKEDRRIGLIQRLPAIGDPFYLVEFVGSGLCLCHFHSLVRMC